MIRKRYSGSGSLSIAQTVENTCKSRKGTDKINTIPQGCVLTTHNLSWLAKFYYRRSRRSARAHRPRLWSGLLNLELVTFRNGCNADGLRN